MAKFTFSHFNCQFLTLKLLRPGSLSKHLIGFEIIKMTKNHENQYIIFISWYNFFLKKILIMFMF